MLYSYVLSYSYSTGPGIYGSKPTRVRGRSPRTREVYVAINPWQPCYNYYMSHLIECRAVGAATATMAMAFQVFLHIHVHYGCG